MFIISIITFIICQNSIDSIHVVDINVRNPQVLYKSGANCSEGLCGRCLRPDESPLRPLDWEKHREADGELLVVKLLGPDPVRADFHLKGLSLCEGWLEFVVVVGDADVAVAEVLLQDRECRGRDELELAWPAQDVTLRWSKKSFFGANNVGYNYSFSFYQTVIIVIVRIWNPLPGRSIVFEF